MFCLVLADDGVLYLSSGLLGFFSSFWDFFRAILSGCWGTDRYDVIERKYRVVIGICLVFCSGGFSRVVRQSSAYSRPAVNLQ
jgi:hypothetical protein